MILKVSLSEMLAEMNSHSELFDRGEADHQNFYRFIAFIIPIENDLTPDNINLKIPSLNICIIAIKNLTLEENNSPLSMKIKTSWFEDLPTCIKKLVNSEIETPTQTQTQTRPARPAPQTLTAKFSGPTATPTNESNSPPVNIRTSPKRPLSHEYKAKTGSPPEQPTRKKSSLKDKLSFVRNIGNREKKVTVAKNDSENKDNVI